jgi:hypothetical protein
MAVDNPAAELESLEQRKRRKDIARMKRLRQFWRSRRHGLYAREVIPTANAEWFDG